MSRISALLGGVALVTGALLIPAAVSAKSGFTGPGFSPVLKPSNVGEKCLPGHKNGVTIAPVKIGVHRIGPGRWGNSTYITVYGLPGARYVLKAPHYTAVIPKGTKVPCHRAFNQGTWVPNKPHSRIAVKWLHYTKCASPHC